MLSALVLGSNVLPIVLIDKKKWTADAHTVLFILHTPVHVHICPHVCTIRASSGLHADGLCRSSWTWADDKIYITPTLQDLM